MDIVEFRKDYLEYVKSSAAVDSDGTVSTYMRVSLEHLVDLGIITDYELCYATGKNGRKSYRIDGYSYDDYDCSMSLIIADYLGDESIEKITKSDANSLFDKIQVFVDGVYNGKLKREIEISTPVYDLLERLIHLKSSIIKFKFFIITDKEMSESINSLPNSTIMNYPTEFHIWDIKRYYKALAIGDVREAIEINFGNFMEYGIPFLKANDVIYDFGSGEVTKKEKFNCYLCVLEGDTLADIFDMYGSRLLEGNVRSFLSTKVSVNRDIRSTILSKENKQMFFAYNNGISATASNVIIEKKEDGNLYITKINNMQIVNGGQTTASLSITRYKDKADLGGIYVQMKLTVISDDELSQKVIPKISRYSNSQNKVNDADFFSNHEFNIRMQKASRRLYAPAVNGNQFETHWFFERSRGQYDQEQSKMTKGEQEKYRLQNPKEHRITKTDIAKIRNTWMECPHYVSMGAQKNFAKFAEFIVESWDKSESLYNELYYKQTVSLKIIFDFIDKKVLSQTWYEKGYKANIVTYTMAYFHFLLKQQFPDRALNLKVIWDRQKVPDEIGLELIKLSKVVFEHITSEKRKITNVTEWCKKIDCWNLLKEKIYILNENLELFLIEKDKEIKLLREGKKEQRFENAIAIQTEIIQVGQDYWKRLLTFGKSKNLISEIDESVIKAAINLGVGKIPSDKQSQRILDIRNRIVDEGFVE